MKRKIIFTLLFALTVSIMGFACADKKPPEVPPEEEEVDYAVSFPDHNLGVLMRRALNKPGGDLLKSELATITELNARKRGIIDLDGIEYCTGLVRLDLSQNHIRDISRLSAMVALTELNLSENFITDISALYPLRSLTVLDLSRNEISDISPLEGKTQLTRLLLSQNDIINIQPVACMIQLVELQLDCNDIADFTPLAANCQSGGLGRDDLVFIDQNNPDRDSIFTVFPYLESKGVILEK